METHGYLLIAISALCLLTAATGVGVAQTGEIDAVGSPDLNVFAPDKEVTAGTNEALTVQIGNEGNFVSGSASDRSFVTTARGVSVELNGGGTPITVETGQQTVGEVSTTDIKTPQFDIVIPDSAEPGRYTLTAELSYAYTSKARTSQGDVAQSAQSSRTVTRDVVVEVTDDPRFKVDEIDSSLRVGEEGEITGRLRNIGADGARSVEVQFAPESDTVIATTSEVAVDDIPAGESARFSIPVEVTTEAEAVPREFDLPVSYRNSDTGIRGTDDDPSFRVDIGGQRDAFLIEPVDSSIEAGGSRALDIEVTNNLGEPVSDIEGKLFADDPLDSSNDETFTTELDPGETTTVTVDLSAASGATLKNYPASMDFRYTDADGDSKLTDSYRLAVSVTEPADDGGGSPIVPLLLGLLVVAGIGAFLWRRSGGELNDLGGLRDE